MGRMKSIESGASTYPVEGRGIRRVERIKAVVKGFESHAGRPAGERGSLTRCPRWRQHAKTENTLGNSIFYERSKVRGFGFRKEREGEDGSTKHVRIHFIFSFRAHDRIVDLETN